MKTRAPLQLERDRRNICITVMWPGVDTLRGRWNDLGCGARGTWLGSYEGFDLSQLVKHDREILRGQSISIKINQNVDVLALKMVVASKFGLPSKKQQLRLRSETEHFPAEEILQDNKTLHHYGIQDGCELILANACGLLVADRFAESQLGDKGPSPTALTEKREMGAARDAMDTIEAEHDHLRAMKHRLRVEERMKTLAAAHRILQIPQTATLQFPDQDRSAPQPNVDNR